MNGFKKNFIFIILFIIAGFSAGYLNAVYDAVITDSALIAKRNIQTIKYLINEQQNRARRVQESCLEMRINIVEDVLRPREGLVDILNRVKLYKRTSTWIDLKESLETLKKSFQALDINLVVEGNSNEKTL